MKQMHEKLERLKNHRTKYELAADGKLLAGYCSHGKNNILRMLQQKDPLSMQGLLSPKWALGMTRK